MRCSNFFYMIATNLAEKKWRTVFAVFVIAFAVTVALAVTAVSSGLLRGIQERAKDMFPPTVVMAKPKTVALAMLAFNASSITDETVKKIQAVPGVSKVMPQLSLKIPLRVEVEIAGQYAVTDAVVIGIDPEIAKANLLPNVHFEYDDQTSQPMPVMVPRVLLDMYNLAYAESMGLPKLSESFLVGKKFTMVFGQTYMTGSAGGKQDKLLCQVVGLSDDNSLVPGAYIPMEYAQRLNAWYSGNSQQPYTALQVVIDRPDQVPGVSKELSDLGLMVEGKQWAYESITFATRAGTALLYGFALLILLVTSFSILNLFSLIMAHRTEEMRLLTAVGGTRATLRWLYFSEALTIAITGVLLGGVFVVSILMWLERRIRDRLESMEIGEISVLPERIFAFDFMPVTFVIIIVLAMSVAAPLVITWKATGREIAGRS